jgi:serine protease Do
MNNRRLLYLALIVATLSIGVVIGSIVSGGVKATALQEKPAPLVIPDPVSLSNAFSQISETLAPAVVKINTEANVQARQQQQQPPRPGPGGNRQQQDPFNFFDFFGAPAPDQDFRARSLGTGFIVDKAGYIVTNHHVVDGADKITVRLWDNSEFQAKVIGSDEETDVAVIKIEAGQELSAAKFGNSDSVKVGDWVLAIGSPFDFDHTVTAGIISAKGRENIGAEQRQFQSFLQTDAAINPGNSGGPLVSMSGDVIGVNTAIISETRQYSGLGFALPSNTAVRVYNQLVQNGKVTRGSIGIQYTSNPDAGLFRAFGLQPGAGVVVESVIAGSPAAKSGLRPGDIITQIDGKKINGGGSLLEIVANSSVGQTIQVRVNRDGREQTIPVTIEDRAVVIRESASNRDPGGSNRGQGANSELGIRVQGISPDMMRQFGLDSDEGVIITAVDPGSIAEEARFTRGMVITRVIVDSQRVDVRDMEDFRRAERLFTSGANAAFMVLRRNPQTNTYVSGFLAVTIP